MLQFTFLTLFLCSQYTEAIPVTSSVYSQEADDWLRLHMVPATFPAAALQCQLEGGVLATPTSSALAGTMRAAMADNKLPSSGVFIGVTDLLSQGEFKSLDGADVANIPLQWAVGEPNNADNAEHCLALTGAGALADVSCSSVLPYFCLKKYTHVANCTTVVPPCNGKKDYVWEPRTGSCYKFHGAAAAWLPALRTCHAEGGHLAVINSKTESTVLKEICDEHSNEVSGALNHEFVSIGFIKWFNDEWVTVHGATLAEAGFNEWSPGQPNNREGPENCGSIFRDGLLNDSPCNGKYSYICEITP